MSVKDCSRLQSPSSAVVRLSPQTPLELRAAAGAALPPHAHFSSLQSSSHPAAHLVSTAPQGATRVSRPHREPAAHVNTASSLVHARVERWWGVSLLSVSRLPRLRRPPPAITAVFQVPPIASRSPSCWRERHTRAGRYGTSSRRGVGREGTRGHASAREGEGERKKSLEKRKSINQTSVKKDKND